VAVASWLIGLSLRLKVALLGAAGVAVALLYLWGRWKIAAAAATSAKARADALAATHDLEKRIAERRLELGVAQRKVREQLAKRSERDAFEDQGWGP
jgi:hypothetical protein